MAKFNNARRKYLTDPQRTIYSCRTRLRGVCGFNENCRQANEIFIALLWNDLWKICPAKCTNDNRAMGQTNEKQFDRTSNDLRLRQKTVCFKCDVKDEQNRSIRGRMPLPIWRNGESLREFLRNKRAVLNRRAKIVDEATDALNESILSSDLIEPCFVFDFVKRLGLRFVANPKLSRCTEEARRF